MKTLLKASILCIFFISACNNETEGCRDVLATNYDSDADTDCNNCCTYAVSVMDEADVFVGSYVFEFDKVDTCIDNGVTTVANFQGDYSITISKIDTNTVLLTNIHNQGEDLQASVNGTNIIFSDTSFGDDPAVSIEGDGNINGNDDLLLDFTITTPDCTIVYDGIARK